LGIKDSLYIELVGQALSELKIKIIGITVIYLKALMLSDCVRPSAEYAFES